MQGKLKYLFTGAIVAVAVIVVLIKYWDYVANPWATAYGERQTLAEGSAPLGA